MADALGVASSIVSLVQISLEFRAYERATISQSYGGTAGFFISTFFGSTASEFERLQRVILRGNDDEALRFRDSVTNECNMTAIAVSAPRRPGPKLLEALRIPHRLRSL